MAAEAGIEQWDLTPQVSPYLDRHMVFPLLEYLDGLIKDGTYSYSANDVAAARLSLLRPTHMVDYAIDVYKGVHGENAEIPKEMQEQRDGVYKNLEALKKECDALDKLCQDKEGRINMMTAGQWNINTLARRGITSEQIEKYRQLARYMFDCGDYKTAREMLAAYISLYAKPPPPTGDEDEDLLAAGLITSNNNNNNNQDDKDTGNASMYYLETVDTNMLQVLWGLLACEILLESWEPASVAVAAVKTAMEVLVQSNHITALSALQQRTWLLHWSLFVYWNDSAKGGLEHLVDLFHTDRYKHAITTNSPHLLRYLTAAVLLCKRRITKKAAAGSNAEARRLMKNLINVMQDCEYSDPIVEFVNCLCVKFDFDSAQTKLAECEKVLATDFFLCQQTPLFMEEARVFVFENYCRIHNKIDLRALGEKLAMDQEQAERWIVDLIRNADLDAKIDTGTESGCVVMGGNPQSIYEQVMDRTRDLNVRSATLAQNLSNVLNDARKEKAKKEKASREDDY